MRARLKRLEKLIADTEGRLAEATAIAEAMESRGEGAAKVRNTVAALMVMLEQHRRARDRTQELWARIALVQRDRDARKGTVRGRRANERHDG